GKAVTTEIHTSGPGSEIGRKLNIGDYIGLADGYVKLEITPVCSDQYTVAVFTYTNAYHVLSQLGRLYYQFAGLRIDGNRRTAGNRVTCGIRRNKCDIVKRWCTGLVRFRVRWRSTVVSRTKLIHHRIPVRVCG